VAGLHPVLSVLVAHQAKQQHADFNLALLSHEFFEIGDLFLDELLVIDEQGLEQQVTESVLAPQPGTNPVASLIEAHNERAACVNLSDPKVQPGQLEAQIRQTPQRVKDEFFALVVLVQPLYLRAALAGAEPDHAAGLQLLVAGLDVQIVERGAGALHEAGQGVVLG
jgi:hypothetical protein